MLVGRDGRRSILVGSDSAMDVLADSRNDFGVVRDSALGAFIHFRPTDRAPINDIPALVGAPTLAVV